MTSADAGSGEGGSPAGGTGFDLARALDGARIAAWHWEAATSRLDWSPGASALLGIPEIVLSSLELLAEAIDPDELALAARAAESAWSGGGLVNARLHLSLDGVRRWYDVIGRALHDDEGNPTAAAGIVLEVTEAHEAQEAIAAALRDAERALERLGSFAAEWDPSTDEVAIRIQPQELTLVPEVPGDVALPGILERMGRRDRSRVRDALSKASLDARPFALEILIRDDQSFARRFVLRGGPEGSTLGRIWIAGTMLD